MEHYAIPLINFVPNPDVCPTLVVGQPAKLAVSITRAVEWSTIEWYLGNKPAKGGHSTEVAKPGELDLSIAFTPSSTKESVGLVFSQSGENPMTVTLIGGPPLGGTPSCSISPAS